MKKVGNARQLTAGEKIKVTLWVNSNRDLCESMNAVELSDTFKSESGINVSPSTMSTTRKEVFPDMQWKGKRSCQSKVHHNEIAAMISDLCDRVTCLESYLLQWRRPEQRT